MNPFEPHKNTKTGCWNPPIYSLRRQAELVKLAKQHGVEELLPPTIKKTEEKARRREEHGLRVKGTGVGQSVKGHAWERTLKGRLEKRRQAMLQMPQLIQDWKQVREAASETPEPVFLTCCAARTWSWVHKVAEIEQRNLLGLGVDFLFNSIWQEFGNIRDRILTIDCRINGPQCLLSWEPACIPLECHRLCKIHEHSCAA